MKKLFIFSILLPVMAFSQGSQSKLSPSDDALIKSAETFLNTFFDEYQNKNWEKVVSMLSIDGIMINETESFSSVEYYKAVAEFSKKQDYALRFRSISMQTQVIGQTATFITVKGYLDYTTNGTVMLNEFLRLYLLEMKDGSWKIKTIYTSDRDPFIYSESVDKKWQVGISSSKDQSNAATGIYYAFTNFFVTEFKKSNIDVSLLGKKYAADWAEGMADGGIKKFENYIETLIAMIQAESLYVEVLDRSDTVLIIKYQPCNLGASKTTFDPELIDFFNSYFSEFSSYFGGESTLAVEGKYWILAVNKK